MRSAGELKTLILNADGLPLSTWPLSIISAQDAICAVIRDKAVVVSEWDIAFRSPSVEIRAPKAIMLRSYKNVRSAPRFCRRNILLRDGMQCQYCLERFQASELTFDHVVPRSAGGKTEWTNVVSCCVECNVKKRDHLTDWHGGGRESMTPARIPLRPTSRELMTAGLRFLSPEIKEDFGSFLFWEQELES